MQVSGADPGFSERGINRSALKQGSCPPGVFNTKIICR